MRPAEPARNGAWPRENLRRDTSIVPESGTHCGTRAVDRSCGRRGPASARQGVNEYRGDDRQEDCEPLAAGQARDEPQNGKACQRWNRRTEWRNERLCLEPDVLSPQL